MLIYYLKNDGTVVNTLDKKAVTFSDNLSELEVDTVPELQEDEILKVKRKKLVVEKREVNENE